MKYESWEKIGQNCAKVICDSIMFNIMRILDGFNCEMSIKASGNEHSSILQKNGICGQKNDLYIVVFVNPVKVS